MVISRDEGRAGRQQPSARFLRAQGFDVEPNCRFPSHGPSYKDNNICSPLSDAWYVFLLFSPRVSATSPLSISNRMPTLTLSCPLQFFLRFPDHRDASSLSPTHLQMDTSYSASHEYHPSPGERLYSGVTPFPTPSTTLPQHLLPHPRIHLLPTQSSFDRLSSTSNLNTLTYPYLNTSPFNCPTSMSRYLKTPHHPRPHTAQQPLPLSPPPSHWSYTERYAPGPSHLLPKAAPSHLVSEWRTVHREGRTFSKNSRRNAQHWREYDQSFGGAEDFYGGEFDQQNQQQQKGHEGDGCQITGRGSSSEHRRTVCTEAGSKYGESEPPLFFPPVF